jgi:Flagellar hook-length control protein FliK
MDMRLQPNQNLERAMNILVPKRGETGESFAELMPESMLAEPECTVSLMENGKERQAVEAEIEAVPGDDLNARLQEGFVLFGSLFEDMEKSLQRGTDQPHGNQGDGPAPLFNTGEKAQLRADQGFHHSHASQLKSAVLVDFALAKNKLAESALRGFAQRHVNPPTEQKDIVPTDDIKPKHHTRTEKPEVSQPTEADLNVAKAVVESEDSKNSSSEADIRISLPQNISERPHPQPVNQLQSDNRQSVLSAVVQEVRALVRAPRSEDMNPIFSGTSHHTLRLNLNPVELGSVDISVSKRGKSLHVTLTPASRETRQILIEDASHLLDRLGLSQADTSQVQLRIEGPDAAPRIQGETASQQSSLRQENGPSLHNGEHTPHRNQKRAMAELSQYNGGSGEVVQDVDSRHRRADAVYL